MAIPRQPLDVRFERNAERIPISGCWVWIGAVDAAGYGRIRVGNRTRLAHRVAYEFYVGAVPRGLELDHLCRVTACINPRHLEPVTRKVNTDRGIVAEVHRARFAALTHCKNGHPYIDSNIYRDPSGHRNCRACRAAAKKRYQENHLGQ